MDLKQIQDDDSLIVVQEANERVRQQFYWLAEEVERLMTREKELTDLLRDIYGVCGATSRASHSEQTAIFQRLRAVLGISA